MVIANSDSTGTLVSLSDHGLKRVTSLKRLESGDYQVYTRTDLLLPENIHEADDDYLSDSLQSFSGSLDSDSSQRQHLYLPTEFEGVDQCLRDVPQVMERCDELFGVPPVLFNGRSKDRLVYVAQGEMAHAKASQCDVLVSDRATTCHILALRSTGLSASSEPLTSLAHLDADHYEDSIRDMIQQHKQQHQSVHTFDLDVHILGGFEDDKGCSRRISNWLVTLLTRIASEERDTMTMTLQTCAITSLNESGRASPVGRGLAIDLKTGATFLARCDAEVTGPSLPLRSLRSWAGSSSERHQLHCLHTSHSDRMTVEPFLYTPFPDLDALLTLPDDVLLQYTSTSPDCEEADFCASVRATLWLMRHVPPSQVFPQQQPRVYRRASRQSNVWKLETGSSSSCATKFWE